MEELLALIAENNAKTLAWIAAGPDRWASLESTDAQDWIDRGITTVEQYKRNELETFIYEGHKDAFGCKGRHYDFASMTMEELETEAEYIGNAIQAEIDRTKADHDNNIAAFEARIYETMEILNTNDRKHIIEVIADAEGVTKEDLSFYGWETLEYNLNIPYGYIKKSLQEA